MQEADEKFDPTDDGCELMTEDLTDEQLGNPVDPGPVTGQLDAVSATTLGITGDGGTLDGEIEAEIVTDDEVDFMTDAEEETCCSTTSEDSSDEDDAGSIWYFYAVSDIEGFLLINIAFQMLDRYVV